MFNVSSQEEWEKLVKSGLSGKLWALEVAAETAISVVSNPEALGKEGKDFLSHLVWLAESCDSIVSWITKPSCEKVKKEYRKFGVTPKKMDLPISDRLLLKRMFNSIPVLWADELI
ncbi:MAG: hypothetical protein ACP5LN_03645 [Thermoproteota archaeon]